MRNRDRDREAEEPSETEPHDEFLELCALSTSGDLTDEEQNQLQAHVALCSECRQALSEFEAAVNIGVPLLSSKLAATPTGGEVVAPARAASDRSDVPASDGGRTDETADAAPGVRVFAFAHRNSHRPTPVNWTYVWLPFAACVVLSVALATYTYRVGKNRPPETISTNSSPSANTDAEALEQQISDADHERQSLKVQLGARDKLIADLRHQIEEQSSSLVQIKTAEANLEQSVATDEAEKQRFAEERASFADKLD